MTEPFRSVGILYHPMAPGAQKLGQALLKRLVALGIPHWLYSAWEEETRARLVETDLLVSLGGDGTILRIARMAVPHCPPILPVNLGHLGFMAELNPTEAQRLFTGLVKGRGWIEERMMLAVEVVPARSRNRRSEATTRHSLNDVVVGRGAPAQMLRLGLLVDGVEVCEYRADALIIATPTGSTAYSFAAGGPIVDPAGKAIIVTPVACYRGLSTPLVLSPEAEVEVVIRSDSPSAVSIDGQIELPSANGAAVRVRRSPHVTRFLRARPPKRFWSTLQQRLSS